MNSLPVHAIRIANLRALAQHNGGVNAFAAKLGYTNGSYISALIGENPNRPVSENIARKFEEALMLQPGYLDIPHDGNETVIPVQADTSATLAAMKQTAQAVEELGVPIGTTKFCDLVELVMEDAKAHQQTAPRPEYIQQLIKLTLK